MRDGDRYVEPEYVEDWRKRVSKRPRRNWLGKDHGRHHECDAAGTSRRTTREINRAYKREYYDTNKEQINAWRVNATPTRKPFNRSAQRPMGSPRSRQESEKQLCPNNKHRNPNR